MAYEVVWTSHARADVDSAISYIATILDSPTAAAQHLDAFLEAVERLADAPELYAISPQSSLVARGLRCCHVKRYVMLYSFDGNRVVIHRVFSMLQDYAKLIEREDRG